MHPSGFLYDTPEPWRQCAKEIRTLANGLSEPGAKAVMMWIAEGYDRIVAHAEQKAGADAGSVTFSSYVSGRPANRGLA